MSTMTYTANMAESPVAGHQGVQALVFAFNSGATAFGTAGDACLLGKIPNGALIIGGWTSGGAPNDAIAGKLLLTYPDNTSLTAAILTAATFTISATVVDRQLYNQVRVSLSDATSPAHALLYWDVTIGASSTPSVSLNGCIYYLTDGR